MTSSGRRMWRNRPQKPRSRVLPRPSDSEVRYGVGGGGPAGVRAGAGAGRRDLRPGPVPGLRVRRADRLPGRARAGAAPPGRRAGRRRGRRVRASSGCRSSPAGRARPLRRGAAGRGRRRDQPGAAQAGPGDRPGRPARGRRAGRHQPGDHRSAAAPHGLYYAPDPSSQQVCTIGGNVAENSGGAHCLKYGFTTNHVLAARSCWPTASVVTVGADTGRAGRAGPARGRARLGGHARHRHADRRAAAAHARVGADAAGGLPVDRGRGRRRVSDIVAAGIVPAAIEMMDTLAIEAAEEAVHAGYTVGVPAALIVELDGPAEECGVQFEQVKRDLRAHGCTRLHIAGSAEERAAIWRGRKAAFAAVGRISPDYFVQDGVVPRTRLAEVLGRIAAMGDEAGLRVANVFHAGDGNLHPLVLYSADAGETERAEHLSGGDRRAVRRDGRLAVGRARDRHGQGVLDAEDVLRRRPGDMQRVRAAFDPDGLCNPGKVFPTPRLCGERPGAYRPHPLEAAGRDRAAVRLMTMTSASSDRDGNAAGPGPRRASAPRSSTRRAARDHRRGHGRRVGRTARAGGRRARHSRAHRRDHPQPRRHDRSSVRAGTPLRALNAELAEHAQHVALDAARVADGATVGGLLATGDAGPGALVHGSLRDLVIGATLVLADGTVARTRRARDQERGGLRPRQGRARLLRHAGGGRRGGAAAAPGAPRRGDPGAAVPAGRGGGHAARVLGGPLEPAALEWISDPSVAAACGSKAPRRRWPARDRPGAGAARRRTPRRSPRPAGETRGTGHAGSPAGRSDDAVLRIGVRPSRLPAVLAELAPRGGRRRARHRRRHRRAARRPGRRRRGARRRPRRGRDLGAAQPPGRAGRVGVGPGTVRCRRAPRRQAELDPGGRLGPAGSPLADRRSP